MAKIRVARDGRQFVTEDGRPFVPFGVTYYRPGTGWAPQLWKQFDPEATPKDFARMKALGVNCARVFLSYGSFYTNVGELAADGVAKFDQFLAIAEEAGIYVHPTGPDHWEGPPNWGPVAVEEEGTVKALESFWTLLAARYRNRHVIFAYDLKNEPEVGWNERMQSRWNEWLKAKYVTAESVARAWSRTNANSFGAFQVPAPQDAPGSRELLDFQAFREYLADEWTRRQSAAIKAVAPDALVTVGAIQWSVPALLPGLRHYSGFRPQRQARYLDFLEIHFYPLASGAYEYRSEQDREANLAYLESVVRETASAGKPVLLAEFGWYGGGKPRFDRNSHPAASEEQQADYCRRAVEVSRGYAVGWLNWGFYDHPQATDCSELTGLVKVEGQTKAWGKAFSEEASAWSRREIPARSLTRPTLDWDACLTSAAAQQQFRENYRKAFATGH